MSRKRVCVLSSSLLLDLYHTPYLDLCGNCAVQVYFLALCLAVLSQREGMAGSCSQPCFQDT